MRKFFTICVAFLSVVAFGQDFKFAFKSDKTNIYIKEEGNGKAWVKYVDQIRTIKNKKGKYVKVGGETFMTYDRYDCKNKTTSSKAYIKYNRNGNVVDSYDYGFFTNEKSIIPGTVGEGILDIVCGWADYDEDYIPSTATDEWISGPAN